MDTCICMAESLCYSPETITRLLISYTPIRNKKFKKKKLQVLVYEGVRLRNASLLNTSYRTS